MRQVFIIIVAMATISLTGCMSVGRTSPVGYTPAMAAENQPTKPVKVAYANERIRPLIEPVLVSHGIVMSDSGSPTITFSADASNSAISWIVGLPSMLSLTIIPGYMDEIHTITAEVNGKHYEATAQQGVVLWLPLAVGMKTYKDAQKNDFSECTEKILSDMRAAGVLKPASAAQSVSPQ